MASFPTTVPTTGFGWRPTIATPPYAVFHGAFWDEPLGSRDQEKGRSLASLRQHVETVDFVIHNCLPCLSPKGPAGLRVIDVNASRLADAVEGTGSLMDNFAWLLAQ